MSYKFKVHHVMNARTPDGKPVYSVSLTSSRNAGLEEIKKEIQGMCSFTRGDIGDVLDNLGYVVARRLGNGETVTIDGIGTFSVSGGLKKGVDDPDMITGKSIELKRICFKPCPKFKAMVQEYIRFERDTP